ncbi:hypothetical protein MIR68_009121 [Amoeboaphelidium protococcarum]|nr:hypothetical protein MIR68_009121 [Amoeboaphelidium protococcarum]
MSNSNIQVVIRVRPISQKEVAGGSWSAWDVRNRSILYQVDQGGKTLSSAQQFMFDRVFHQENNAQVYSSVQPLIKSCLDGFNATIFAYGQTNSGKTHTMQGSGKEIGIIPLAMQDLFSEIQNTPSREFLLRVSYLEIYNEVIKDLLCPENDNLKIHETAEREIFVGNVREEIVTSVEEVIQLMQIGERNRHVGVTNMNERSSRSHTLFQMVIESRDTSAGSDVSGGGNDNGSQQVVSAVKVSQLNLVDLAGSERCSYTGAEGARLREGGHINRSLLTLGTVISKLSENSSHVPYRDSKLTRILQNSLGGNAKTAIICTASPANKFIEETYSTLKFASRAKTITNCPEMNEIVSDEVMLKRYQNEISELKNQLSSLKDVDLHHKFESVVNEKIAIEAEAQEHRKSLEEYEDRIKFLTAKIGQMEKMVLNPHVIDTHDEAPPIKKQKMLRRQTWFPGRQQQQQRQVSFESADNLVQAVEPARLVIDMTDDMNDQDDQINQEVNDQKVDDFKHDSNSVSRHQVQNGKIQLDGDDIASLISVLVNGDVVDSLPHHMHSLADQLMQLKQELTSRMSAEIQLLQTSNEEIQSWYKEICDEKSKLQQQLESVSLALQENLISTSRQESHPQSPASDLGQCSALIDSSTQTQCVDSRFTALQDQLNEVKGLKDSLLQSAHELSFSDGAQVAIRKLVHDVSELYTVQLSELKQKQMLELAENKRVIEDLEVQVKSLRDDRLQQDEQLLYLTQNNLEISLEHRQMSALCDSQEDCIETLEQQLESASKELDAAVDKCSLAESRCDQLQEEQQALSKQLLQEGLAAYELQQQLVIAFVESGPIVANCNLKCSGLVLELDRVQAEKQSAQQGLSLKLEQQQYDFDNQMTQRMQQISEQDEEIERLLSEVDNLTSQVLSERQSNEAFERQIATITYERNVNNGKLSVQSQDILSLQNELLSKQAEIEQLTDDLESQNAQLQNQLDDWNAQKLSFTDQIAQLQCVKDRLILELEEKRQKISRLQQSLSESQSSSGEQVTVLQELLKQSEIEVATMQSEKESLQQSMNKLQAEIDVLVAQQSVYDQSKEEYRSQLQESERSFKELQSQLSGCQNREEDLQLQLQLKVQEGEKSELVYTTLEQKFQMQTSENSVLQSDVQRLTEVCNTLKKQVDSGLTEIQCLKEQHDILSAKHLQLELQKQQKSEQVVALNDKLSTTSADFESQVLDLQSKVDQLNSLLLEQQQLYDGSLVEKDRINEALQGANASLATKQAGIDRLNSHCVHRSQQFAALKLEIQNLQQMLLNLVQSSSALFAGYSSSMDMCSESLNLKITEQLESIRMSFQSQLVQVEPKGQQIDVQSFEALKLAYKEEVEKHRAAQLKYESELTSLKNDSEMFKKSDVLKTQLMNDRKNFQIQSKQLEAVIAAMKSELDKSIQFTEQLQSEIRMKDQELKQLHYKVKSMQQAPTQVGGSSVLLGKESEHLDLIKALKDRVVQLTAEKEDAQKELRQSIILRNQDAQQVRRLEQSLQQMQSDQLKAKREVSSKSKKVQHSIQDQESKENEYVVVDKQDNTSEEQPKIVFHTRQSKLAANDTQSQQPPSRNRNLKSKPQQDEADFEFDKLVDEELRSKCTVQNQEIQKLLETECFGWILYKGLPPLGKGPLVHFSSPRSTSSSSSLFSFEIVEGGSVPIIQDLPTKMAVSVMWNRYANKDWRNEEGIKQRVNYVLSDCIYATSLEQLVQIVPGVRFPSSSKSYNQTELGVSKLNDDIEQMIGAVQVKRPPNSVQKQQGIEFDMNDIEQIVSYLYDLRVSFGVRFVFGILSTYEKWRFVWFDDEDTTSAISAKSIKEFLECCVRSPSQSAASSQYDLSIQKFIDGDDTTSAADLLSSIPSVTDKESHVPDIVRVVQSRVYHYTDTDLVGVLRTLLFKWAHTPRDRINGYLHPQRLFPAASYNSQDYEFRKLPMRLKQFSYQFPLSKSSRLYFLHVYQKTGDGRTTLICKKNGQLGVAKFIITNNDGDHKRNSDIAREIAHAESERWREIWEVQSEVVEILQLSVVLLPFVFHIREYPDELRFCPMRAWNYRLGIEWSLDSLFEPGVIKEDSMLSEDAQTRAYLANPLKVAREALHRLIIECGWMQPDQEVRWRHIGLMPVITHSSATVTPVMIDLTRLIKIADGQDRQTVYKKHYDMLRRTMPAKDAKEVVDIEV